MGAGQARRDDEPRRHVAFVEMPVFAGIVPLASGLMEAYARADPELDAAYSFDKHSFVVGTPFEEVWAALERRPASVYALSCYVWNAGFMRKLLARIRERSPDTPVILGGPQVISQAPRYLDPRDEHSYVCNGEGERIMAGFLRWLLAPSAAPTGVRGLGFYRGGELVTTDDEPRITSMDEIPSPYLQGLFEPGQYIWYMIETNRGCPFKCSYCYWGAATGSRVYRYDDRRIEQEIEWICRAGGLHFHICDANWGMLPRDLELSRYLADCKRRYGAPYSIHFTTSKNTPDRVNEIARVFHEAGLLATQTVSLQTMSEQALELVDRKNIRTSAYMELQRALNERRMASALEMIWPLPGETLESFKDGIAQLCELGAQSFMVHTLLLMNNVALAKRRAEFGLVTVPSRAEHDESERVIATRWVGTDEYRAGLWFTYALHTLYDHHALRCVLRCLSRRDRRWFVDVLDAFVRYCAERSDHPYARYIQESIDGGEHDSPYNVGGLLHTSCHAERDEFDRFLVQFVRGQPWSSDPEVALCFEVDLLNRPYVYRDTPVTAKCIAFEHLRALEVLPGGYEVEVAPEHVELLRSVLDPVCLAPGPPCARYVIDHRREQLPFMPGKSHRELYSYCQSLRYKLTGFLGTWSPVSVPRPRVRRTRALAGG